MVHTPLLLALLFSWMIPGTDGERRTTSPASTIAVENAEALAAEELYAELCLENELAQPIFAAGYRKMQKYGVTGKILAIADMTQPSDAKRFYIIDLDKKELVLRTYVAHGQGSGERMATSFSNKEGSHATSLGLYRVGAEIVSPKHGAALLLHGLERGVNCQAESREVIMHGADYVSETFIAEHGRLGRSWGCPAVSRADMPRMLELLADGGLLYVHGSK
jgi:hypothetical protein